MSLLNSGVEVGEASGFEKKPGGAPANVAVAVAKLGQPSVFLGQVGDDPFGHHLESVLRAEGVNTDGLRFSDEARTALAFVSLRADGERSFVFYRHPSADMVMRPDDVAFDLIDEQDIFHFGTLTLIAEPGRSATLAAVDHARAHGKTISYDPNLRMSLWKDEATARAGLLSGLDYAHIVKVSDEELEFLTGGNDPAALWREGMRLIVVTHGAGGATLTRPIRSSTRRAFASAPSIPPAQATASSPDCWSVCSKRCRCRSACASPTRSARSRRPHAAPFPRCRSAHRSRRFCATSERPGGSAMTQETEGADYTVRHHVEDGIEWISYIPRQRNPYPPILMQHGMWHGAWCWRGWQECFAEWGWETHAISLPGHGGSPTRRPIRLCTLGYYLGFIKAAVDALPQQPILMGHSMGGALTQWYLRDVGNLPAAVLVAPWALYRGFWACAGAFWRLDWWGGILSYLVMRSEWARTPERAAKALLSPDAILSPQELYSQLSPELLLVLQHALPWRIPETLTTPILWLGGERDAVIPEFAARRAASSYPTGEYVMVESAAHNIMMEPNYREIAGEINRWLNATLTT